MLVIYHTKPFSVHVSKVRFAGSSDYLHNILWSAVTEHRLLKQSRAFAVKVPRNLSHVLPPQLLLSPEFYGGHRPNGMQHNRWIHITSSVATRSELVPVRLSALLHTLQPSLAPSNLQRLKGFQRANRMYMASFSLGRYVSFDHAGMPVLRPLPLLSSPRCLTASSSFGEDEALLT